MTPASVPTTIDELRATVAELVGADPAEIDDEDDLILDWALDSVRAMTFVTALREQGVAVDLVRLSESPTISAWWALLSAPATAG